MSNRLTKIYTRTGDDGTTGMANGSRLSKADLRFEAMGKVDMLNAQIGLLRAVLTTTNLTNEKLDNQLRGIQHQLFNIGGELAMPEFKMLTAEHSLALEQQMDEWNTTLPRLKDFILPAGSQAVCQVHIARCACRDAEHTLVAVNERDNNLAASTLSYINRLSDWLFVLARMVAKQDNEQTSRQANHETLWQKSLNQA